MKTLATLATRGWMKLVDLTGTPETRANHLNKLNLIARTIMLRDMTVEYGESNTCDGQGKITVAVSEGSDPESYEGIVAHECAHALFSQCPAEITAKLVGVSSDGKERHTLTTEQKRVFQLTNVYEDLRVDSLIKRWYPDSDYLLSKLDIDMRRKSIPSKPFNQHLPLPAAVLAIYMFGFTDIIKMIPKPYRVAIKAAAELRARAVASKSTSEVLGVALEAYSILSEFYPKEPEDKEEEPEGDGGDSNGRPNGDLSKFKNPSFPNTQGKDPRELRDESEKKSGANKTPKPGPEQTQEKTRGPAKPTEDPPQTLDESESQTVEEVPREYIRPYRARPSKTGLAFVEELGSYLPSIVSAYYSGRSVGKSLSNLLRFKKAFRSNRNGALDIKRIIRKLSQTEVLVDATKIPRKRPARVLKSHNVELLVDFSGSMGIEKLIAAKRSAAMLSGVLCELNVPHAIHGFTSEGGGMRHIHYPLKAFGSARLDLRKLTCAANPEGYGATRDAESVLLATEEISKFQGDKIIFVISDGESYHNDGEVSERRFNYNPHWALREAVNLARIRGIKCVCIAIEGSEPESLRRAYEYVVDLTGSKDVQTKLPNAIRDVYLDISSNLEVV